MPFCEHGQRMHPDHRCVSCQDAELSALRARVAELQAGARSLVLECHAWMSDANAALSRISGILCDASDVEVDPLPDGVSKLLQQRNEARRDLEAATDFAFDVPGHRFVHVASRAPKWQVAHLANTGEPSFEDFDTQAIALARARELANGGAQ